MRIAVTGSSGLIGSALCASLEADGDDVVRVVRSGGRPGTVRWDIDADVFRGRTFDFRRKFLPDGLTKVNDLPFLTAEENVALPMMIAKVRSR